MSRFWQSSSFVAITVKLHRRISLTILQRCSLLKNMIRRETEAILAILLWLSCWCSFSAASKPKLSAVAFIIGCRREATPKHKTGPAAVAFSIECRRGECRKSDRADSAPKLRTSQSWSEAGTWKLRTAQLWSEAVRLQRNSLNEFMCLCDGQKYARRPESGRALFTSSSSFKSFTYFLHT